MKLKKSLTVALIVAIAFFMQFLDTTAVNTAVPAMAESFGTDVIRLSTGITSYLIALAIFIPVSGWIADRFGTRRVFCTAIALFIFSSALCGTSQNLMQFIIYRVMQGMAGAMMSPVGRLAVLKVTPKEELPDAMNYITVPALIAPVIGPLVGGYLTTFWSWHWIFYLNIPISIICIILAWRYIPQENCAERKYGKFDPLGFLLSGAGLAGFMYGVDMFSKKEIPLYLPLLVIITAILLLLLNIILSCKKTDPLIDYSVMRIKTYRITILTGLVSRIVIGVYPFLVPLMFQEGFGLSPFEAGLLFLSTMLGNLAMKSVTVWIIRRFRFRNILIINGAFVALFTFFTALLLPDTPVIIILLTLFATGLVRSMQFSSLTTLAFADISKKKMTSANTLYSTVQQMSVGTGIALGAVALRFSNMLNGGVPGTYTVADFRLSFIFVAVIGLIHLWGYLPLAPTAGDVVRIKKERKKVNRTP